MVVVFYGKAMPLTHMIKNTISILLMLLAVAQAAAVEKADSVYRLIDKAMAGADAYFERREARIDGLKSRLQGSREPARRYALEFSLYEEYRGLSNDSALAYIERAAATAAARGDKASAGKCMALEACQCSMSGLYAEALVMLDRVDLRSLDSVGLPLYYHARSHLYGEIAAHTAVPSMKSGYAGLSSAYEDSLLAVTGEDDALYLQHMEKRMFAAGDYYGALRYNEKWMRLRGHVPTEFAVIAFYRYLDYKMLGNKAEWTYWLAMSALADIRNGTTDQASMWELAQHMYTTGDYARANRYIDFAGACVRKFHTALRSYQVMPVLSVISKKYQTDMASTNRMLYVALMAASVFALTVLCFAVYLVRQRKRLAAAQAGLREGNERLTRLNGEMQKAMRELDLSNRRLTATGERLNAAVAGLDESNRVKEKYIGLFLRQCSSYIERMDHMRRDVLAMVKAKRYGELYDMVKKHGFRDKEQEELFEIFDSTFIRLFPTFVDEFNQLLRPECRIALADQSKLNTGVRIFALIRLGIDDSSKIAEFLHYSVNTIYNYRARIKNGAMVSRDEFEDMVRSIGLPRRVAKGCSDTTDGGPSEE